jgi:hypothetical protein
MLNNGFSAADPRWNDLTHETGETEQEEEENGVWITAVTPTFDMIRVVDPSRGEVPNVKVVQKEGLMFYANGSGAKKGRAFWRAADGSNGPGLGDEVVKYEAN